MAALQPIRGHVLASAIYHFFDTGLYDCLADAEGNRDTTVAKLAEMLGFNPERLDAFLRYLCSEHLVSASTGRYSLSPQGRALHPARAWYTLLVGGYGSTLARLGDGLLRDAEPLTRDAAKVASGSCGISHYGAIPLTRELLGLIPGGCSVILDVGCGNGLYLAELCQMLPSLRAVGVEPDSGAHAEALDLIAAKGLDTRVRLVQKEAHEFLIDSGDWIPDAVIFGFVLHEIHGQRGELGVRETLTWVIERFPDAHVLVIEVDWRPDDLSSLESGLSLAYYNPYFLLHPFTQQRLRSAPYWESLFEDVGFSIIKRQAIDPRVDSTGLELGYLLHPAREARLAPDPQRELS